MATVLDEIKGALRLLGVLRKGEAPAADEAQEALQALLNMLGSWANDSLLVPARTWEAGYVLTPNQSTYTIGTGLNINTVRPIAIVAAYYRDTGNNDYPLEIITDEQYAALGNKLTAAAPIALNYDTGYATGRIRLDCPPNLAYTLFLQTEKPLTAFAGLATVVDLPPGWSRAIRSNLALELSSEYGVGSEIPMPARLPSMAAESLDLLKKAQMRNRPIVRKTGPVQGFNILTWPR